MKSWMLWLRLIHLCCCFQKKENKNMCVKTLAAALLVLLLLPHFLYIYEKEKGRKKSEKKTRRIHTPLPYGVYGRGVWVSVPFLNHPYAPKFGVYEIALHFLGPYALKFRVYGFWTLILLSFSWRIHLISSRIAPYHLKAIYWEVKYRF